MCAPASNNNLPPTVAAGGVEIQEPSLEAGARQSTGNSSMLNAGGEPSRLRLLAHFHLIC